jgi:phosphoribosylanthranilate isomerase
VGNKLNIELLNQLPKTIHKVGVFVNSEINYILDKVKNYQLEFVQLHGSESVKYCQELKEHDIKIIKAFQIEKGFDFNKIIPFKKVVDYFLFDTKTSTYGGSGKKFNWDILEAYDNEIPFFLSGGISLEDANTIKNDLLLEKLNIKALDINSCFETLPAVKNTTMVSNFIKKINNEL